MYGLEPEEALEMLKEMKGDITQLTEDPITSNPMSSLVGGELPQTRNLDMEIKEDF